MKRERKEKRIKINKEIRINRMIEENYKKVEENRREKIRKEKGKEK